MAPIINKGDLIAFKRITDVPNHLFSSDIYLILQGNETEELLTISQIQPTNDPENVKFVSQNKNYPDQIIPISNIKALAKVKIWISINSMS